MGAGSGLAAGTRAGMSQKTKEMPVYDRPIKIHSIQDQRGGGPTRNWDSRFEASDHGPGRRGIFDGGGQPAQTNPTGLSAGGSIR